MIYLLALLYTVIVLTAILGIYGLSKMLQRVRAYSRNEYINDFYWATVIVCAVINFTCIVISFSFSDYLTIWLFIIPMVIFFFIEVISVWIIVKDFKTSDSLFCVSNRYILRAIHTLAVCHILWFMHRVGYNLIVTMYFIALAPVQALVATILIYSVIFCTIIYVAYNLHCFKLMRKCCTRNCCSTAFRLFIVFLLYCGVIGILFCLTMIFNELITHGLNSSGLGSVILSLVALALVFIITLKLKGQVKKLFEKGNLKLRSDKDLENPPEVAQHAADNKVESTENIPLLINNYERI